MMLKREVPKWSVSGVLQRSQERSRLPRVQEPRGKRSERVMATFFKNLASFITSAFLEMPEYEVLSSTEEYEVRHYPESKWVSTKTESIATDKSTSELFQRLSNYIAGKNESKKKIEMTAPVAIRIIPGAGPNCENAFHMSFYLGKEHWDNAPKADSADVYIETFPVMDVYCRTFGGFAKDDKWIEEASKLAEVLPKDAEYNKDYYYTCGYDAPFKLFGRRNEVWFVKESHKSQENWRLST